MPRPVTKKQLLGMIQQFAAIEAIGTSAVRGQPAGTKKAIQRVLSRTKLSRMPRRNRVLFERWLDRQTERIRHRPPSRAKPWGVARKALNLFLRDCLYNHYLRTSYGLTSVERWLEVPLDGVVGRALRRKAKAQGVALPQWPGLKRITAEAGDQFQAFAEEFADCVDLPARVFLDNYLWLTNRESG